MGGGPPREKTIVRNDPRVLDTRLSGSTQFDVKLIITCTSRLAHVQKILNMCMNRVEQLLNIAHHR